ncbi:hypothetical protein BDW66DRAFT_169086 [Aspergillus desertorum]
MKPQKLLPWVSALVPSTTARTASFHPPHRPDITFSISVPSSSNPSSVLFRIQAQKSIEWIALAQGTHMADANMFLVYASETNPSNITVSPRTAPGHVPPRYNHNARVALLPHSGIDLATGDITAEIECFTCLEGFGGFMDPDGTETRWVWAFKEVDEEDGETRLRSDDVTARIAFHDEFGRVVVDLSRARTDPSSSSDLFSDPDFSAVRPVDEAGDDRDSKYNMAIAHGLLMSLAFLLLFPVFALSVPLGYPLMKTHAPLQGVTLGIALLGAVLGFNIWNSAGRNTHPHPILGLTLISTLLLIQPVLGYIQHEHFLRVGGKSYFAYVHRWLGRVGILLGVVNGMLGFAWVGALDTGAGGWHTAMVWYLVVAGVGLVAYVIVRGWFVPVLERKRKGVLADIQGRVDGGYRDLDEDEDENVGQNGVR